MTLTTRFLISFLLLADCGYGEEFTPEYSAAALQAARRGDCALVETLVKSGADPNYVATDGHSLLIYACRKAYGSKAEMNIRINHVKFLLSKGANVNLADSFGIVSLLVADRVGSVELIDLLKRNGATNFDLSDMNLKAAATLIDGELLLETLERMNIEDGSKYFLPTLQFEELKKYRPATILRVFRNQGNDLFGRPFGLSTFHGETVTVHPDTLKEFASKGGLKADYWKSLDLSVK